MEPFEEQAALFRFEWVTVGPKGGDVLRLAGCGRAIDFAQCVLGFPFPLFHPECVEVIVAGTRAEDVWIFFGPAFGEA